MQLDINQEKQLIEACKQGKPSAQKTLYGRFAGEMLVVCMRYCKSKEEAEDILQESFIKIFQSIKDFREDSRLYFWVKRVVVNTALNSYRKNKNQMFLMADDVDNYDQSDEGYSISNIHWKDLMLMIQKLPAGCQTIFNLYAIEGYNHKEIGELLGVSEGTSKSQYSRARQLMQQIIKKENRLMYGTAG
jgi:RNA polymerase sigma factor (sigma-70 family)